MTNIREILKNITDEDFIYCKEQSNCNKDEFIRLLLIKIKEYDDAEEEEEDVECNSCEAICDRYDYNECEECSKIICDSCRHSCYSICYDCKPKGMLEEEVECECCEEEEEVDHNYCEKCGRPSEVWGGNPNKSMCKKCSISEGWAKWCDKHDKISYKTEKGEGCRDCKKEDFYNPYKNTADYA